MIFFYCDKNDIDLIWFVYQLVLPSDEWQENYSDQKKVFSAAIWWMVKLIDIKNEMHSFWPR